MKEINFKRNSIIAHKFITIFLLLTTFTIIFNSCKLLIGFYKKGLKGV